MIDGYLRELNRALGQLGVPRHTRRRIIAETADHLRSDPGPDSVRRFGEASAIAQRFADELGARQARTTSLRTFAVLAVAGLFYGVVVLGWAASQTFRTIAQSSTQTPAQLATVGALVIAPQAAFVAGLLALVRGLRLRGRRTLPAAEVRTLNRRSVVALICGIVGVGATIPFVLQHGALLPPWSSAVVFPGAAVTMGLMLIGAVTAVRGARLRVQEAGAAGDVFDDIGPVIPRSLRGRPWSFAFAVAAALALGVAAAGVAGNDAYDGVLRAIAEGGACLFGFALLGRYLGLRG